MRRVLDIEGYTLEQLLALPPEAMRAIVFTDEPFAFRIGTAEVLGAFRISGERLVAELAHIDGGGEGVLVTLVTICQQYARQNKLREIEWIVHALHCANPNLVLRRVLERRGFVVEDVPGVGDAYHLVEPVARA